MPTEAVGWRHSRHAEERGRQRSGRAAEQPDVPQLWGPTHSGALPLLCWQSSAQVGFPHPLPVRHPEEHQSRLAG